MLFHISILLSVLYRLSSLLAGITILQRRHLILKRWIFVKFFVHGQITPLLYNAFKSPHSQIILLEKISKSVSTNLIIIKKNHTWCKTVIWRYFWRWTTVCSCWKVKDGAAVMVTRQVISDACFVWCGVRRLEHKQVVVHQTVRVTGEGIRIGHLWI